MVFKILEANNKIINMPDGDRILILEISKKY